MDVARSRLLSGWIACAAALLAVPSLVACGSGDTCPSPQVMVNGVCATPCSDLPDVVCYADASDAAVDASDVGNRDATEAAFDAHDAADALDVSTLRDVIDAADVIDVAPVDVLVCEDGSSPCSGTCVDLATDPANCGSCGTVCTATGGTAICASGSCSVACAAGMHACGTSCAADNSPMSCGALCTPCATPMFGTATCTAGACGFTCAAGTSMTASGCDPNPPRPIAPLSTATVTSQRPTFHWMLAPSTDGAEVEICRDRACSVPVTSFMATGTSGQPTSALAAGLYFWRLHGAIGGHAGAATGPTWEFVVGARTAPVDTSWGTFLDVNGDGFADVAVGAPGVNNGAGSVYVYLGSASGLATNPVVTLNGTDGAQANFGWTAASAGDVNGDGFADLVVGASGVDRAYLFLGGSNGIETNPAASIVAPGGSYSGFAIAVSSAGDTNADGYADIVIGAFADQNLYGAAYVYLGSASGLATTATARLVGAGSSSNFGWSVASAGDTNGDGFGDVVIGAYGTGTGSRGAAFVYSGGPSGILGTPSATLASPGLLGNQFGYSVSSAGDVNGDGFADVVIGAPAGFTTYVFIGGANGVASAPQSSLVGPDGSGSAFGNAVSSAGDLNRDGYSDVAVAAYGANSSTGRVYVFDGSGGGILGSPSTMLTGPDGAGGYFGHAVQGAGDIDRDGYFDLLVGATGVNNTAGMAYEFAGTASGLSTAARATLSGSGASSAEFGNCIAL